ncbi:MAG: M48 family metallopeptidase [Spirochaetia bacterium]|jgi:STE24 endopeptidase|nr:M48 family metallopeptidase [Spirochaetia bacterium]
MSYQAILILYLVFFALDFLFQNYLTILNIGEIKKNSASVPSIFTNHIDVETYRKSAEYTRVKSFFTIVSGVFSSIILLLIVLTGTFGRIDIFISEFSLNPYIEGLVYIFVLSLLFYIIGLPFSIYSQFRIEEKFGFNKMTVGLFIIDQIKNLVLSGVILSILLLGLFLFMDKAGAYWWIIASVGLILFQLVLSIIYPLFIAPLFNKFAPLEEDNLKNLLKGLAGNLKFKTTGIFIMDGSKRSGHSNAYFTGVGKAKRIVLYDTLVSILSNTQIAAVLAHEIGHYKKHHLIKGLVLSFFVTTLGFFVVNIFLNYLPLFEAFGFSRVSYHGIFVILSFAAGPFTFFLTPLFTMWSRKHEYEADAFAAKNTDYGEDLKEGLIIMSKENLSNLTPHPLYSFYHYSHPTVGERIKALDRLS